MMDNKAYNFTFSIKDNQLTIDGNNEEQLYKLNKQQNGENTSSNNQVILKEKKKNEKHKKKKTHKLSIFKIKKKQKKSKGRGLLKQTNVRCQKEEDLN
jgi:hypothetical protein